MKTIKLSSPEGNVFFIVEYVTQHLLEDQTKRYAEIQRYFNLGDYDTILKTIEKEYPGKIKFVK